MRSKAEFIRRFEKHLAGGFLFGTIAELREGPIVRASHALDIRDEVTKLLTQMYEFLATEEPAPNGKPAADHLTPRSK